MNRYASFFKGYRFKNTIVDGYSVVGLVRFIAVCIIKYGLLEFVACFPARSNFQEI